MYLRQATASQPRAVGPFLDDTDFKTLETALTIANTDVKLIPNGGTQASKNSGGGTHRGNAMYSLTFDATDTAAVGELTYTISVSGALPVFGKFFVLEEAVYDMLFAASAIGYVANSAVNVAQWAGTSVATPVVAGIPIVHTPLMKRRNTAQAGGASTITVDSGAGVADVCPGDLFYIVSGTGAGQSNIASTYSNATKVVNMIQPWPNAAPDNSSVFEIWKIGGAPPVDATSLASASSLANVSARVPSQLSSNGNIKADIKEVNDVIINGAGTGGSPFGP